MENNLGNLKVIREQQEERTFEIRHHQIETERARELKVTDLLKEYEGTPQAERIALSKADIILIYGLYENGVKEFFKLYKEYVEECSGKRYKACDKPHWYLKRSID